MIEYKNEYIAVPDYAKRCGITTRAAYDRVRARTVASLEVDSTIFINIDKSPMVKQMNPNQRRLKKNPVPPMEHLTWKQWKNVTRYAYAKGVTAGVIFRLMITGKIDGLVIADSVFFKPEQLPA
jgi:hypothetical protein